MVGLLIGLDFHVQFFCGFFCLVGDIDGLLVGKIGDLTSPACPTWGKLKW